MHRNNSYSFTLFEVLLLSTSYLEIKVQLTWHLFNSDLSLWFTYLCLSDVYSGCVSFTTLFYLGFPLQPCFILVPFTTLLYPGSLTTLLYPGSLSTLFHLGFPLQPCF